MAPESFLTMIGIEEISTIKIRATSFSQHLIRKLKNQLRANLSQSVSMNVSVSLLVDPSGRLFFEAKCGKCWLGKGPLRFDSTKKA